MLTTVRRSLCVSQRSSSYVTSLEDRVERMEALLKRVRTLFKKTLSLACLGCLVGGA